MKSKTFIVMLGICAALGAAAVFISRPQQPEGGSTLLGQVLLPDLAVQEIAAITLASPDGEVRLHRKNDAWRVSSRFDYPADFQKITRLVQQLREMKIGRAFEADGDVTDRLALNPPGTDGVPAERTATRIVLENPQGSALADLLLGRTSSKTSTQYVLPKGKTQVYLVDQSFEFLSKTATDWLDTTLLDIPAASIREVICRDPKTGTERYTLRRMAEGQAAELVAPPKGRSVRRTKVDEVIEALSGLDIDDVADPAAPAPPDADLLLEYRLFDGSIYTLSVGPALAQDANGCYLRVQADYRQPASSTATGADKPPEGEKPAADPAAEIGKLNQRLSSWTYVIPKWKRESFLGDPESFLEKVDSEEGKS